MAPRASDHVLALDAWGRRPQGRQPRKRPAHRWFRSRCSCGWEGPARDRQWEASFDGRAHRDGWGDLEGGTPLGTMRTTDQDRS
jgi:hypothetical protein